MTVLTWDAAAKREYQRGLDRGVLYYAPSNYGVPWNGLVSVSRKNDHNSKPVWFDGRKVANIRSHAGWEGTIKSISYPDEFLPILGHAKVFSKPGVYASHQAPQQFGMSYRTMLSDATEANPGYLLHILYNLEVLPRTETDETTTDDSKVKEHEWDVISTDLPSYGLNLRPTSHIYFNSRVCDPGLLLNVEEELYGTSFTTPQLPPGDTLLSLIDNY